MSVIEDLANTASRLSAARTGIQNAIKAKGVTVASGDGFEDFETKIRSIAQLDTSDANATASDIMSGKSAYVKGVKVNGSYTPLDTSDANATSADIVSGKSAYVNGTKVNGNLVFATVYSGSTAPSSSLGANGDFYVQL